MSNVIGYGLYEGVNAYEQAGDYLRFVWKEKPSIQESADGIGCGFPSTDDKTTLLMVKLWQGESIRLTSDGSHWQIREIKLGTQEQ